MKLYRINWYVERTPGLAGLYEIKADCADSAVATVKCRVAEDYAIDGADIRIKSISIQKEQTS